MAALTPKFRTAILILIGCAAICSQACAQSSSSPPVPPATQPGESSAAKPLPEIVALMRDVETNQRKSEAVEKNYIYHSVATEQEFDGHGQTKKTIVTESDHFWVNGVPVRRVVKKDGKDLSADEIAKENERIDKLTAKSSERREKADNQGKETDPRGNEEVTVSRLIELGAFTNARRVQLDGRDTIAVDFVGNPKAKTRNRTEEVIRDMVGTAWIDEQDHVLARADGHFVMPSRSAAALSSASRRTHASQ